MDHSYAVPAVIVGGIGSTVSLVRSLGRAGVPVQVLGGGRETLAGASHFCRSVTHLGPGPGMVDRWLLWLENEGPRGAVLLPSGDEGVELIAGHRDRLERAGFRLPPTAGETSLAMLDKARTYELARDVGIPCPQTWTVAGEGDLDSIRDQLTYPCALKPLHSHLFSKHFPQAKVLVAHDEAELAEFIRETGRLSLEMLVTEIVAGPERFTWTFSTYLDEDGRPLFGMTRNKLRSEPIHFGTNCYVVTRRNPEVARLGLEFLQRIGLRGIAHVEFKWDAGDRTYKLMECNHRFVNPQEVIRRAGVDVALLAYQRALGIDSGPMPQWREGVRLWWPERDFRAAVAYRREGETSWRKWVRSLLHRPIYTPRLALDDPGPTVLMGARRLKRGIERLRTAQGAQDHVPPPSDGQGRFARSDPGSSARRRFSRGVVARVTRSTNT